MAKPHVLIPTLAITHPYRNTITSEEQSKIDEAIVTYTRELIRERTEFLSKVKQIHSDGTAEHEIFTEIAKVILQIRHDLEISKIMSESQNNSVYRGALKVVEDLKLGNDQRMDNHDAIIVGMNETIKRIQKDMLDHKTDIVRLHRSVRTLEEMDGRVTQVLEGFANFSRSQLELEAKMDDVLTQNPVPGKKKKKGQTHAPDPAEMQRLRDDVFERIETLNQRMNERFQEVDMDRVDRMEESIRGLNRGMCSLSEQLEQKMVSQERIDQLEQKMVSQERIDQLEQQMVSQERKMVSQERFDQLEQQMVSQERIDQLEQQMVSQERIEQLEQHVKLFKSSGTIETHDYHDQIEALTAQNNYLSDQVNRLNSVLSGFMFVLHQSMGFPMMEHMVPEGATTE